MQKAYRRTRMTRYPDFRRPALPSAFRIPRSAFTLMEVLVVIALLGSVTAFITVDLLSLFESGRVPTAYETLHEAMDAGRLAARGTGTPVKITFSEETSSLRLIDGKEPRDFALPAGARVKFFLPADVSDAGEKPLDAVVFHPSGCATPAGVDLEMAGVHAVYRLEMFSATLSPEERK